VSQITGREWCLHAIMDTLAIALRKVWDSHGVVGGSLGGAGRAEERLGERVAAPHG